MAERAPVTQVWTDFGGVLTPPVHVSLAKFCAAYGLTQEEFMGAVRQVGAHYGTTDILEPLDTPLVDEPEWLRQVSEALGRPIDVRSFGEAWFDDRPANEDWVATLQALRGRGVGVSLMSNMVPAWDRYWRRMVNADVLFDHVVLSFEVHCRKPGRDIFELAASRSGATAAQCVLIDDSELNCAGAEAAGWRAVHFADAASAAAQLGDLLPEMGA